MAKDAAPFSASLEIDGLRVATARGRSLLDVPGLSVPSGTLLGVRGPSGAGKSTLLHALSGILENAQGRVIWGGQDILSLSPERRAAFRANKVGMVFQDFMLFDEMSPMANATVSGLFRRALCQSPSIKISHPPSTSGSKVVAKPEILTINIVLNNKS